MEGLDGSEIRKAIFVPDGLANWSDYTKSAERKGAFRLRAVQRLQPQ